MSDRRSKGPRGGPRGEAPTTDEVERLVFLCLGLPAAEQEDAIRRFCRDRSELAPAVRRRLAVLQQVGLLAPEAAMPPSFAGFRLLRRLGAGGMGVVYLAEQVELGRRVALKLIRPEQLHFPRVRERFQREGRAASKLDHPGICHVYEVGESRGTPYIAMQYVEGRTLADLLKEARKTRTPLALSVSDRADTSAADHRGATGGPRSRGHLARLVSVFEQAGHALQAAHDVGLIHRDIKPGNIMIARDGRPVILDFGLALDETSADPALTLSGDALGTPAYMSPEQIASGKHRPDRRTDVYSLGATLYECLTLRCPFEGSSREDLYRQILSANAQPPSRYNAPLPRELDVVVAKALDRDPERRYQSAFDLAEDLRRVRCHEPIRARRTNVPLRIRRWAQRNPVVATCLLLLSAGLAVSLYFVDERNRAKREARAFALAAASREAARDDPQQALFLARRAVAMQATPRTIAGLSQAVSAARERLVLSHEGFCWRARFLPGRPLLLTASEDRTARLWTLDGREVGRMQHRQPVAWTAFSPRGGGRILTANYGRTIHLWGARGEDLGVVLEHGSRTSSAAFSPAADVVATSTYAGEIHVWNFRGRKLVTLSEGPALSKVQHVAFSRDGERLVAACGDGTARVWRWRDEVEVAVLRYRAPATRALFAADGKTVLVTFEDGMVALWDGSGSDAVWMPGHRGLIFDASFSPGDDLVVTVSRDKTGRVWDRSGRLVAVLMGHSEEVYDVEFSACGRWIATAANDHTARIWDVQGRPLLVLRGHTLGLNGGVAFSADGEQLLTASADGTARLWDLWDRRQPILAGHDGDVVCARPVAGGRRFVTVSMAGRICLFDEGGRKLRELPTGDDDIVWAADVSPDGEWLLTSPRRGCVRLWNLVRWKLDSVCPRTITGKGWGCAVFVGGRRVVTIDHDEGTAPRVTLWDLPWKPRLDLSDVPAPEYACASPDGKRLLVTCGDGKSLLLDGSGRRLAVLDGSADGMALHASFSPDGRRVVTVHWNGKVRLWGTDGRALGRFAGHRGIALKACFSPRGDRILSCAKDGEARVWDTGGTLLAVAGGHAAGTVWDACFLDGATRVLTAASDETARVSGIVQDEVVDLARIRQLRVPGPDEWARYEGLLGPYPGSGR